MEKNISVVDEQGNEYEATYPKRAKGLVKNGRARFVDENTICLACPPHEFETEDIKMSENIETKTVEATNVPSTLDTILSGIKLVTEQTDYLMETIKKFNSEAISDAAAQSLVCIIQARETTNQQTLKLYEKMYDNISDQAEFKAGVERDKWNVIAKLADVAYNDDDFASERAEMLDSIRQILRENK